MSSKGFKYVQTESLVEGHSVIVDKKKKKIYYPFGNLPYYFHLKPKAVKKFLKKDPDGFIKLKVRKQIKKYEPIMVGREDNKIELFVESSRVHEMLDLAQFDPKKWLISVEAISVLEQSVEKDNLPKTSTTVEESVKVTKTTEA